MPKLNIEKSITIDCPIEKVFESVRDFKQWKEWSPWIIAEPDCKITYAKDGKSYDWEGKIIGAGGMQITEEDKPTSIKYKLTFLKPWKSESEVEFKFAKKGDGTEVTWTMDGSLPFFLFFMKKMMTAFIGMDYERGLAMLKPYLEDGSVPVKLDFEGEKPFSGFRYIGYKSRSSIAEMGEQMAKDFEHLNSYVEAQPRLEKVGAPFTMYSKWNPVKGFAEYTVGIPVEGPPPGLSDEFAYTDLPDFRTYVIKHTGPYPYLGNGWSAGHMHARGKIFRQNKKIYPFEIYENDPRETDEKDLVTVIHFPVKE